jgi:hypothetical protein
MYVNVSDAAIFADHAQLSALTLPDKTSPYPPRTQIIPLVLKDQHQCIVAVLAETLNFRVSMIVDQRPARERPLTVRSRPSHCIREWY